MSLLVFAGVAWVSLIGCNAEQNPPPGESEAAETSGQLRVLETVLQDKEGPRGCRILNSRAVIDTCGIRQLREEGIEVVPDLVALMRTDELSFDTFTRCYSAAEQILREIKPDLDIGWQGGAKTVGSDSRGFRLVPGGQMDVSGFRKQIADEIWQAYLSVSESRSAEERAK